MNDEKQDIAEIIQECLQRLAQGETPEAILFAYPRHAAELLPLLRAAAALRGAPAPEASAAVRAAALGGMVSAVESARTAAAPRFAWLAAFRSRSSAYQGAALAGALLLFGALGLGGAAATGNAPEPVRAFFGVSSTSVIKVEFEGTITSVLGNTLSVNAAGDLRTVRIRANTEISGGGFSDLQVGLVVEVEGTLLPDNTIAARKIEIEDEDEDDDCDDATPRATPTAGTAAATATPELDDDDDDGDDSDNSGPGGDDDGDDHEDDQDDDDQDDDDADDVCATTTPRATPTAGTPTATATPDLDEDDDEEDDADDDADDDNSGPGGDDTDNSGPDGGDEASDD